MTAGLKLNDYWKSVLLKIYSLQGIIINYLGSQIAHP